MEESLINKKGKREDIQVNIYAQAKIIRDKHTKFASLETKTSSEWSLFEGCSIETIDLKKPISKGVDMGVYPLDTSPLKRNYYKLVTHHGSAILSEKHLPMEGGYNFRDLGGIESENGKHVRWGKFFRSDDLFHLTDGDLDYLSSIPITTIVDFRCEEECILLPDKFPESIKNYYNLSIHPGSLQTLTKDSFSTKGDVMEAMKGLYRLFITHSEYLATYREFFQLIQSEKELPLLFHCSAGKDRTGFAAALLLFALGVSKEVIMEDYLESNFYLGDKYQSLFEKNPVNKYLYTIIPDYLEAALSEIIKVYGNISSFLEKELKVNIELLQAKYLF